MLNRPEAPSPPHRPSARLCNGSLHNLRCYVVIELKAVPFDLAFIGQINVYLSAVDDLLRHPGDQPAIGLLLCRSKDRIVVEQLPENLKGSLPAVEEIEAELSREENER